MKALTKKELNNNDLSNIDEARKNKIMEIKNGMSMSYEGTLNFASDASENLTAFSTDLLQSMKLKDVPEVEGLITDLMGSLEKVDVNSLLAKKPNFLQRLFKVDNISQFTSKYQDVSSLIVDVKEKLEDANLQLRKDIEVCNQYLAKNIDYVNALDDYIVAGQIRLGEEKKLLDEERKTLDQTDTLAVQDVAARQGDLDRLERKIHSLLLMREIAIQNVPQILLIRDGDGVLVEKIDSSINSAIPLWESQMVIAIQLMRQRNALTVQKAVTDTTNKLIEQNSEMLRSGSVEIAKELESGIVDVEVLKKSSQNLLNTLNEVKSVRENGKKMREKATQDLIALQTQLNAQLIASGNNENVKQIGE